MVASENNMAARIAGTVWNICALDRILRNGTRVLRKEDLLTWLALFHIDGFRYRVFYIYIYVYIYTYFESLIEGVCLQMPSVFSESWLMAEMANGITFRTSIPTELGLFLLDLIDY